MDAGSEASVESHDARSFHVKHPSAPLRIWSSCSHGSLAAFERGCTFRDHVRYLCGIVFEPSTNCETLARSRGTSSVAHRGRATDSPSPVVAVVFPGREMTGVSRPQEASRSRHTSRAHFHAHRRSPGSRSCAHHSSSQGEWRSNRRTPRGTTSAPAMHRRVRAGVAPTDHATTTATTPGSGLSDWGYRYTDSRHRPGKRHRRARSSHAETGSRARRTPASAASPVEEGGPGIARVASGAVPQRRPGTGARGRSSGHSRQICHSRPELIPPLAIAAPDLASGTCRLPYRTRAISGRRHGSQLSELAPLLTGADSRPMTGGGRRHADPSPRPDSRSAMLDHTHSATTPLPSYRRATGVQSGNARGSGESRSLRIHGREPATRWAVLAQPDHCSPVWWGD